MPSTTDRLRSIVSRCDAGHGAMPNPQLPMTAVVTPSDDRGRQRRVPGDLRVVVRVDVDDAGHQGSARASMVSLRGVFLADWTERSCRP